MKCKTVRQLLWDYLADGLDITQRQVVSSHLTQCPRCQDHMERLRSARSAIQAISADEPPACPLLAVRIKAAARQLQAEPSVPRGIAGFAVGSPAFVATCASLLVGAVMAYLFTTQVYLRRLDAETHPKPSAVVATVSGLGLGPTTPGPLTNTGGSLYTPTHVRTRPVPVGTVKLSLGPPLASTCNAVSHRPQKAARLKRSHHSHTRVERHLTTSTPAATRLAAAPKSLVSTTLTLGGATAQRESTRPLPSPALPVPRRARLAKAPRETRVARTEPDGSSDRAVFGGRGTASGPAPISRSFASYASEDATGAVVARLVASYVVERYVCERMMGAEPTLLAVSSQTSTHSPASLSPASLSDGAHH